MLVAPAGTGVGLGVGVAAGDGAGVGVARRGDGVAGFELEPDSEGSAPPDAEPPPPQAARTGSTSNGQRREDLKDFITLFMFGLNVSSV